MMMTPLASKGRQLEVMRVICLCLLRLVMSQLAHVLSQQLRVLSQRVQMLSQHLQRVLSQSVQVLRHRLCLSCHHQGCPSWLERLDGI